MHAILYVRSALRLDKVLTQRVEEGCVDVRVRARTYTLYRSKGMNVRNSSGDSMHQWQLRASGSMNLFTLNRQTIFGVHVTLEKLVHCPQQFYLQLTTKDVFAMRIVMLCFPQHENSYIFREQDTHFIIWFCGKFRIHPPLHRHQHQSQLCFPQWMAVHKKVCIFIIIMYKAV